MMTDDQRNPSDFSCHALIVGAGLCGLATAIALGSAGHMVTVFERSPVLREIGAGIQLSPNATRLFQAWKILDPIMELSYQPEEGSLRSYKGDVIKKLASGKIVAEEFKSPYLVIHRADLLNVLVSEAQKLGVKVQLGVNITGIDFKKPSVTTSTGEIFYGDVLFGGDGERSICRDELLGYSDPPQSTGDVIFRIAVKRNDVLQKEKLKELTSKPTVNVWMGPDSHAVSYLLKNDILNVVLIMKDPTDREVMYGPQKAEITEVRNAFKNWDPVFETLLDVESSDCSMWSLLHIQEVAEWCDPSGRFALIGDAAHSLLPYLAQGAAQAFEDAGVLGTLFAEIKGVSQIPSALSIYENLRKPRTTEIRRRTLAQKIIYGMNDGPEQEARDKMIGDSGAMEAMQRWLWGYDAAAAAKQAWDLALQKQGQGTV